jgi:hypothetical protein
MSLIGTTRKCRRGRCMSVVGGTADHICSERVFPGLTHNGHRRSPKLFGWRFRGVPVGGCKSPGPFLFDEPRDLDHASANPVNLGMNPEPSSRIKPLERQ